MEIMKEDHEHREACKGKVLADMNLFLRVQYLPSNLFSHGILLNVL